MKQKKLVLALILIILFLFVMLIQSTIQRSDKSQEITTDSPIQPTAAADSTLTFTPDVVSLTTTDNASVDISIHTGRNQVTAIQLEIEYDPAVIADAQIEPGTFFNSPLVLLNKNDQKTGKITYAIGIPPGQSPITGTGIVAVLNLKKHKNISGIKQSTISILPASLVTAAAIDNTVLKQTNSLTITINE